MLTFIHHVQADAIERPSNINFKTRRELLNIERVQSAKKDAHYHRLSVEFDDGQSGVFAQKPHWRLMAEYKNGAEWWVLGFIMGDEKYVKALKLPKWQSPEQIKLDREASGKGNFDISLNSRTKLWEIVDKKKSRKVGACLHERDISALIAGYIAGEEKCTT